VIREFQIGYAVAKQLRPLAECEQEHAAIARLHDFRGTEADVLLAAAMFERVGEAGSAAQLLRTAFEMESDSSTAVASREGVA